MERRNQLRPVVVVDLSAQLRYRLLRSEQRLGRKGTERHDHLGFDCLNLSKEEGLAAVDFVGFRVPVLRWTALHNVRNVNVVAAESHRLDHLGEQLSSASDEWHALQVLVRPWRLADE